MEAQYEQVPEDVHTYLSIVLFYQQLYEEATAASAKGPNTPLRTRVLFNLAHRAGDEPRLMAYHQQLRDKKEDQLSLAAVHYNRSHFQVNNAMMMMLNETLRATSHDMTSHHIMSRRKPQTYTSACCWRAATTSR